ncbi:unnamed protein product [Allacma fusca]|uniref:Uncharacterized protein n=1 Tax=Allacma fusca TaxID=39272 RepID=A0A8J2JA07_9HEXA|nr:unnamed protein product [Allacma fusca]
MLHTVGRHLVRPVSKENLQGRATCKKLGTGTVNILSINGTSCYTVTTRKWRQVFALYCKSAVLSVSKNDEIYNVDMISMTAICINFLPSNAN